MKKKKLVCITAVFGRICVRESVGLFYILPGTGTGIVTYNIFRH